MNTLGIRELIVTLCLVAGPVAAQEHAAERTEPVAEAAEHEAVNWLAFGLQCATFAIFVGGIVYFARTPIRSFFAERHTLVKKAVQEAQAAKAAAEAKFAEYQKKMGELDSELEKLRATMKVNAEAERTRLVNDAEAAKKRIERDTEAMVSQELGRAREQLRAEAAELAVKMAEEILHREMKPADQQHLVSDYTAALNDSDSKAEAA